MFLNGIADFLPDSAMPGSVFFAWQKEQPELSVTHDRWRELFRRAGYTVEGEPAEKLGGADVVLYRGADMRYRRNWSWTPDLGLAEEFAVRAQRRTNDPRFPARVWRAVVPWANILACSLNYGDREYVVDTEGVVIHPFWRRVGSSKGRSR